MTLFNEEELAIIAIALDEEEEEAHHLEDNQQAKRIWVCELWEDRETAGEFHTLCKKLTRHPKYYYHYFKMSESTFHLLLQKLQDSLRKKDTNWRQSISPMERLAVMLRFLTTGDSFKTIAFSYRMGFSTVQEIVTKTCKCIVDTVMSDMLPRPTNEMWKSIAKDFNTLWSFPNCIGALDGKHITIQSPPNSGSLYFNYKKTFSIVLLALVDANYNFTIVDVGSYEKNSDGGIFANSNLGKELQRNNLSLPEASNLPGTSTTASYVLVGDEACPLKSYLMRPYPGTNLSTDKQIYNYRLSRARRVVENTFGQLTSKFRIYNRRLNALPKNVDNIILSTCILHNFIKKYDKETNVSREAASTNESLAGYVELPALGSNASREAFAVRDMFKSYFNSPVGAVPWQNNRI